MERKYDLIIFGATGYTGRYVIRNAVKIFEGMKWAIAGRNYSKLQEILLDSGKKINVDLSKIPILIADVYDEKSLANMAKQAKVIINTCGPFNMYGETVVKACVENGTNHVDVSGEPQYMDTMLLKYGEEARKKGIFIISACGMESIPSEMGISFIKKNFNGTINSVDNYVRVYFDKGFKPKTSALNFGTYSSIVIAFSKYFEIQRIRAKLYPNSLPNFKPKSWPKIIHRAKEVENRWSLPLIEPDRGVVNKTQRYFYEKEGTRPIQFNPYWCFTTFKFFFLIALMAPFFILLTQFSLGVKALLNFPNFFFYGIVDKNEPEEDIVEKINFEVTFVARGWKEKNVPTQAKNPPNKKMVARVIAKNPAYEATSVSVLLCARKLIKDVSKLSEPGVVTPGIAFEKTNFIEELQKYDYTFEILKNEE